MPCPLPTYGPSLAAVPAGLTVACLRSAVRLEARVTLPGAAPGFTRSGSPAREASPGQARDPPGQAVCHSEPSA